MHILVNSIVFIIMFKESGSNSLWTVPHLFYITSLYKPHGPSHCYQSYIEGTQHHQPCPAVYNSTHISHIGFHIALCCAPHHCCTCRKRLLKWHINKMNCSIGHIPTETISNSFPADLARTSLQDGDGTKEKSCSTPGCGLKGNTYVILGIFLLAFPNSYGQDTFGKGINNFPLSIIWKIATSQHIRINDNKNRAAGRVQVREMTITK